MSDVASIEQTTARRIVALGDVAINSTVATQTPETDGFTRYIIGKHIPGNGSKITKWNEVGDGEFGSRIRTIIKSGDIVCTTRGPKLRVAVATFDCLSAHTNFILRTINPDILLQEYLQAIVFSDEFHRHLRRNFRGSTNLFVNWSDAAKFEFTLPPIEEQRRIVDILSAGLSLQYLLQELAASTFATLTSFIESRLRGLHLGSLARNERVGRYHESWELVPLKDLLEMSQYGLSEVAVDQGRYPMLRMMNLENGYAVENDIVYIDLDDREFERYRLHAGDVLFNRTNSYELVGRTGVYELDGHHVFASYLVRLRMQRDRLDPTYLCSFLNSPVGRRQVMSFATRGVSQTNVNASNLGRVLLPLPPLDYQQQAVASIRSLQTTVDPLNLRVQQVRRLLAKIVDERVAR